MENFFFWKFHEVAFKLQIRSHKEKNYILRPSKFWKSILQIKLQNQFKRQFF